MSYLQLGPLLSAQIFILEMLRAGGLNIEEIIATFPNAIINELPIRSYLDHFYIKNWYKGRDNAAERLSILIVRSN